MLLVLNERTCIWKIRLFVHLEQFACHWTFSDLYIFFALCSLMIFVVEYKVVSSATFNSSVSLIEKI